MASVTTGLRGAGTLRIIDDVLEYRATSGSFTVPLRNVALAGEYTTAAGPAVDDYFLVFVTRDGDRHEASFYARGRAETLSALSTYWGAPITPRLAASSSLASNIVWPPDHAGAPLFTYDQRLATTAMSRLRTRLGFGTLDEHLSPAAQAALGSGGAVRHPHPSHSALVADDDPNIVRLITKELQRRDWTVDAARDGAEVLAKAQRTNYAVIVLDLGMPHMNGYEVLRRLREKRFEQRKRVIVITGKPAHLRAADRRIVEAVVQKPVRLQELNEHVDRIAAADRLEHAVAGAL